MTELDARKCLTVPFALLALRTGGLSAAARAAADAIRDQQQLAAQDAYFDPLADLVMKTYVPTGGGLRLAFQGDCEQRAVELTGDGLPAGFWSDAIWNGSLAGAVRALVG